METLDALLPGLTPLTVLLAVVVCFLAAALGGMSGVGSGMIITLFITPIIGPKAVVPVISVLMLINNASRAWFYREYMQPKRIALIAGTAVPASALGALLYVRMDSDLIQGILGAILIASVPLRRWTAGRMMEPSRTTVIAVSGAFGFLSSIIVGAGMLVLPILMGFGLAGPALLATDGAIAVIVNLAKIIFFGSLDALTLPLFVIAFVMGLCTIPGTWVAAWIVKRTDIRIHTLFVEALIVVGGASFIYGSLTA
ncbi:MAG: sulfite exporter TauE/SafE family protein [Kiloniellaceae bacterium]